MDPATPSEIDSNVVTAAPSLIFDPTIYEREVLLFAFDQTEDSVDKELFDFAKELGIPLLDHSLKPLENHETFTTLSTLTSSSEHRSSISIRSHSTGVTSNPSRASKEQHQQAEGPAYGLTALPVRPSYDSVLDTIRPRLAHSRSSSSASGTSVKSFQFAARKLGIKGKRGHRPSIFRKDNSGKASVNCGSRLHHDRSAAPTSRTSISETLMDPALSCGHPTTQHHIRMHVVEATISDEYVPPSCCGKPIPGNVLEMVMSKAEMDELLRGLLQTYGIEAAEDGAAASDFSNTSSPPKTRLNPTVPTQYDRIAQYDDIADPKEHAYTPMTEEALELERIFSNPGYRNFRQQQAEELDRFRRFKHKQKKVLTLHHSRARASLQEKHALRKEELEQSHLLALERLEETQISAELDVMKAQEEEVKRVATALKYMERYCYENPTPWNETESLDGCQDISNPQPQHEVSDEDRFKLKRQYAIRDSLPQKHASAINVLRARQDKSFKSRQEQQRREKLELDIQGETQKAILEITQANEEGRLNGIIEARRKRLSSRWDLKIEVWRRNYERATGPISERLKAADWLEQYAEKNSVRQFRSALDVYLTGDDKEQVNAETDFEANVERLRNQNCIDSHKGERPLENSAISHVEGPGPTVESIDEELNAKLCMPEKQQSSYDSGTEGQNKSAPDLSRGTQESLQVPTQIQSEQDKTQSDQDERENQNPATSSANTQADTSLSTNHTPQIIIAVGHG